MAIGAILVALGFNGLKFRLNKPEQDTLLALATIAIGFIAIVIGLFLQTGSRPFYLIVGVILIALVWPLYVANPMFGYGAILLISICLYNFLTYKKGSKEGKLKQP